MSGNVSDSTTVTECHIDSHKKKLLLFKNEASVSEMCLQEVLGLACGPIPWESVCSILCTDHSNKFSLWLLGLLLGIVELANVAQHPGRRPYQ